MHSMNLTYPATIILVGIFALLAMTENVPAAQFGMFEHKVALARYDHRKACYLRGEIKDGDAKKLKSLLQQEAFNECTLFLDSNGGSLDEALKIIEVMGSSTPTHISAGAKCFSACAIVFMGGRVHTETEFPVASRTLDIRAKVGFHQPGLKLKGAQTLVPLATLQPAYTSAVIQISKLIRLSRIGSATLAAGRIMPNELLLRMLKKPPEDMYLIKTVEDLIISGISILSGTRKNIVGTDLRNVCDNFFWQKIGNFGENNYYQYGGYKSKRVGRSVRIDGDLAQRFDDYEGLEGTTQTCDVVSRENYGYYMVRFENQSFQVVPRIFGLPRNQQISKIKMVSISTSQPATKVNSEQNTYQSGFVCAVIRKNKIIDRDPCSMAEKTKSGREVKTFLWPSGAKTVVTQYGSRLSVNGARPAKTLRSNGFTCGYNGRSGNYFCYQTQ